MVRRWVVLVGVVVVTVVAAVAVAVASSDRGPAQHRAPARAKLGEDDNANSMRRLQRPKLVRKR